MLEQFKKGAEMMVYSQALLTARVAHLQKAKVVPERKQRRKKRIREGGDISKAEADELAR